MEINHYVDTFYYNSIIVLMIIIYKFLTICQIVVILGYAIKNFKTTLKNKQ